ncbi:hypothetical protein B0H16DRAFT_1479838 [Mycena metata]|uniref:Transmembrane protein n=1 Tax=Mycena metata TaxID=1033252 RepID=A0AAD7H484_9AGAR|nr:hypothetical protein B0H16DRAFT_1479838 [Mycena metata]
MRLAFLFNPIFRVWTLRVLLIWTLFLLCGGAVYGWWTPQGVTCLGIIFLHSVLRFADDDPSHQGVLNASSVVQWPLKGLATLDLLLTLLEIAELVGVTIVAGFRISTIVTSSEPFFRQRLTFLGGCAPVHPPYTPMRILFNRSMTRPLIRGESRPILFMRACVIWCIGVGLPIFAFYYTVFMPATTQTYRRDISPFSSPSWVPNEPLGNASIFLASLKFPYGQAGDPALYNIQVQRDAYSDESPAICETKRSTPTAIQGILIQCDSPWRWSNVFSMSISVSFPFGGTSGLRIAPVQGDSPTELQAAGFGPAFGTTLDSVPLFGGSNLVATFTWTRTSIILDSFPRSTADVYTATIDGFQPLPGRVASDPNRATLTLIQRESRRLVIETADATVLNGIATLGGFWTFLNGRRPLSALGLVHVFQRRRHKRQWDEEFPTIRTEGGLPGSESAGIVAFIRERLVDLGQDPHENQADQPDDVEAQETLAAVEGMPEAVTLESVPAPNFQTRAHSGFGYILDEIPLLDVDLGFMGGEILKSKNPI